ncbi:MAG: hypothetical protein NC819_03935 [Candidatus Omnitrophica bacterium]|nr:hypothetical protein [Candidatus Omnitrophota bacterium]
MIRTTIVGNYPKVSDHSDDNLPGVIDKWQRKLLGDAELENEIQKVIRRVIWEQEEAGLSLVTDGQIRWEDLPHPIVKSVSGLRRGVLRRFFDNNVYYRRLELAGPVRWQKSVVADEYRFAAQNARKPVKVSLPGPLTLVEATQINNGTSRESLLDIYTELLVREIETLNKTGVRDIQIEEPALGQDEPLAEKAIERLNRIFKGITTARRWLALYFRKIASLLPKFGKLQVEVLSVDLVTNPDVLDLLRGGVWTKDIALGLIDARNTKLESAAEIKRVIGKLTDAIPLDTLWLTPNCGLEFLPHEVVKRKLRLMQEIAGEI